MFSRLSPMPKARIIAGSHRRLLFETGDNPSTRPTKDRVKESVFNQLEPFTYRRVLDAFAGVGSLSFEAMSRGAKHVDAIEKNGQSYHVLLQNTEDLKMPIQTYQMDAFTFLERPKEPYDLIFLDPPYQGSMLHPMLEAIRDNGCIHAQTECVCLHETDFDTTGFVVISTRKIGRTTVTRLKEKP